MADSIPPFDLYATLGVAPDAPVETIVAAHRTLIRRHHPDVSDGPRATQATQRLNVARDWLADPDRRARYDRGIAATRTSREPPSRSAAPSSREHHASRRPAPHVLELYFFVARSSRLTRREMTGLEAAYRRAAARDLAFASAASDVVRLAQALGRSQVAIQAVDEACADLPAGARPIGGALRQVLRSTAFALAVADVDPVRAGVILAPWREVTRASDAAFERRRRRTQRARVVATRLVVAAALGVLVILVIAGVLRIAGAILGS